MVVWFAHVRVGHRQLSILKRVTLNRVALFFIQNLAVTYAVNPIERLVFTYLTNPI